MSAINRLHRSGPSAARGRTARRRPAPLRATATGGVLAAVAALLSVVGAAPQAAALPAPCAQALPLEPVVCRFGPTGAEQTFTVPAGVTELHVTATGGDGGAGPLTDPSLVPRGATVEATVSVTPGAVLSVVVGGAGGPAVDGASAGAGGWNGGGAGGAGSAAAGVLGGGGGGGATDLRAIALGEPGTLASRLLVAAGAGGWSGGFGPDGGPRQPGGDAGRAGSAPPGLPDAEGGGAGSATGPGRGGAVGAPPGGAIRPGADGALGVGGAGAAGYQLPDGTSHVPGGGGGGGLYGGGGGSAHAGGGGGGSFGPAGAVIGVKETAGPAALTITYVPRGPAAQLRLASLAFGEVGVPFRPPIHAANADGASYADVTADTVLYDENGVECPAAGCTYTQAGNHDITATYQGLSLTVTIGFAGDDRLERVSGDGQGAGAGERFERLRVRYLDQLGQPGLASVGFAITSGDAGFWGSESRASVVTGGDGIAKSPPLIAGSDVGPVTVVAAVGQREVTFSLMVEAQRCQGHVATIVGTKDANRIRGTEGVDVVVALGGDDTVTALGGDDLVCLGDGDDHALAGAGSDQVSGGAGADVVEGAAGDDVLRGRADDDRLFGNLGDDHLYGGPGDDYLDGGPGHNVLRGGPGHNVEIP